MVKTFEAAVGNRFLFTKANKKMQGKFWGEIKLFHKMGHSVFVHKYDGSHGYVGLENLYRYIQDGLLTLEVSTND